VSRLTDLDHDALSAEQRQVMEDILAGPRDSLDGPFGAWLRSPQLADRAQRLGEFVRFRTSLPQRLVELAVLFTACSWRAQFEWYAHAPIARREGLSEATVRALFEGSRPLEMRAMDAAVYDFCRELYERRRVSDATYECARRHLGEQGVVELVGVLGYYALVAMTLNVFAVGVPAGQSLPFVEPAAP
jgi:4-carboxymuconolactone decarboxylase